MLDRLSIRARLTAAFAAAMTLVLVLAGSFVYLYVSSELTGTIDDGLENRAVDLAQLVVLSGEAPPELSGGLFESEGGFSQIVDPDGEVLASTLAPSVGAAISPEQVEQATEGAVFIDDHPVPGLDGPARILAQPVASDDGRLVVIAGTSTEDRDEALAGIASAFLIGGPIALILASGLGYLLATRSMAPVEAMTKRAGEITLERSGERLPIPQAEDEIRRLGETLNTMLDRLEASLERERVFVADASHELRTPLAVLRAELELANRPGRTQEELRSAVRSAIEEVERLVRLAEDLLVIARSDQGRLPINREPVEVRTLLERVHGRFERRAGDAGRELVLQAPDDLQGELDVLRMDQALGNLVDNALAHGSGEVRLSARRENGTLSLEVSDEGPGFPAGFEREAFERFARADEGRTGGGAGLGLSIVQAIAKAHGGRVQVASDGGRGATVRISLPSS